MTRGLVIGKFLPVHNGHVALIRFAASHCDELIVSMSYRNDDPIDPQLRVTWLRNIFACDKNILIGVIADDFDNDTLPWPERTLVWAQVIKKAYPPIHVVVSSEEYGPYFGDSLAARHVAFDPERRHLPVSATLIRQSPLKYWAFIPPVVRPYFVRKFCFYGPESTGKSSMAERMAIRYHTAFVPEVAREFLTKNVFTNDDIVQIGKAHHERIQQKELTANRILFVDTDAITTIIYSNYYLGVVPEALFEFEKKISYDHYFLFDIDVPWVPDGLRDLPHKRKEMFEEFRDHLERRSIPYTLVTGNWEERESIIVNTLHRLLGI
jgi:HTH-type transcriptional regulator, transcriptional repressor of NAD biosynthesis genes